MTSIISTLYRETETKVKRPPSPYSGKGLPPESAAYATQTDHRSQVRRADARRAKHAKVKKEREYNKRVVQDPELPPELPRSAYPPVGEYQSHYFEKLTP